MPRTPPRISSPATVASRVRRRQRPTEWTSLEIAKLAASLLTPIVVAGVGFFLGSIQQSQADRQSHRQLVAEVSHEIYERRYWADMLYSALERADPEDPDDPEKQEVIDKKYMYDQSTATWHSDFEANLLKIRRIIGANQKTEFEQFEEDRLDNDMFGAIDDCLTKAYETYLDGQESSEILDQCHMREMLTVTGQCAYAVSDQLAAMTYAHLNPDTVVKPLEGPCKRLPEMYETQNEIDAQTAAPPPIPRNHSLSWISRLVGKKA